MPSPNILIIIADDLGVDAFRIDKISQQISAHVVGPTDTAGPVRLSNFERLLGHGVHFEHAWAQPVCTPTRASLFTGMQAWKTSLGYPTGGGDNLPATTVTGVPITSLAQALKAQTSYRCAMFGKWDLGPGKNPVQWGWDYFAGIYAGGLRPVGVREYGFPPPQNRVSYQRLVNAQGSSKPALCAASAALLANTYSADFLASNPDVRYYIWHKDIVQSDGTALVAQPPSARAHLYATKDQVEDAKAWIAQSSSQGPWCVALNLITPHDPLHLPPPGTYQSSTVTNPSAPTVPELLVAMMESMDYYLGDLLAAIDDQLDNTIIIFAGDNGTQDIDPDTGQSVDQIAGDDKSTSSIGGILVPLIVADGGLMKSTAPCYVAGTPRSVGNVVHLMDLYRTVLDIAGAGSAPATDSISMAPHLTGSAAPTRTHNFSQMYLVPTTATGGTTPGINASGTDTQQEHKLTCRLKTDAQGRPLDRNGALTSQLYFEYAFSQLAPEPDIPGSFVEVAIDAIQSNGSTHTITNATHQAKILELYSQMRREYLTSAKTPFPIIIDTARAPQLGLADMGYASGWRVDKHPRMLAKLTGSGMVDLVGFGDAGMYLARNNGDGTFAAVQLVIADLGYDAGWRVDQHPRMLADLTGDGRADVVGFGGAGVYVALNNGDGTFAAPQLAIADFGYDAGWRVDRHPRMLADLTGDGKADIVGFGDAGVYVALNNGNGTFAAPQLVLADMGYVAGGWRVDQHPRMLADVTGKGRLDLVGFGGAGVYVAVGTGSGGFEPPQLLIADFGYDAGWRVDQHPRMLADVTGKGQAYVVGFGGAGVLLRNG